MKNSAASQGPSRRPVCPRCQRPHRTCCCTWVRPVANALPVWVFQHPEEVGQAKGSLTLLALSLQACRVEVAERIDAQALARARDWLGARPRLLYPPAAVASSEAAAGDLESRRELVPPGEGPPTGLLVLDATWRKSRKMLHLSPALAAWPRLSLQAPPDSRYAGLRRAPQPQAQRSTLEATCLALADLSQDARPYAELLAAFGQWCACLAVDFRPVPPRLADAPPTPASQPPVADAGQA
ncbi:tRNA-uridine aminocarboxypropyltransferase [Ideonella livida]|uniref:tRNA-uridine aminocarboxypropyltransferase n=1 Tax=Ideonella livida TaxID=2707176 RepID=A0A7C9TKE7_9BURK|nr:tRNA-uridine aminocarboxypropyltransferase [Ideonella livida]NDY91265.1 DTW domain-containing protein [Ideonella livida]